LFKAMAMQSSVAAYAVKALQRTPLSICFLIHIIAGFVMFHVLILNRTANNLN
jgi:type IV secretory pathway TrbL component